MLSYGLNIAFVMLSHPSRSCPGLLGSIFRLVNLNDSNRTHPVSFVWFILTKMLWDSV